MGLQGWMRVTAGIVVMAALTAILVGWRADRHDRAQLGAELAATKQALVAADARQQQRDAQLAGTLAQIAAEKQAVKTPVQIVAALPKVITLPVPIRLENEANLDANKVAAPGSEVKTASSGPSTGVDNSGTGQKDMTVRATIAAEDLKPLYDFALDCKACQAKLAASQSDLADERGKGIALTKERDSALRMANGGGVWRRVARASKWLLIGAAAGAVAARMIH